MSNGNVDLGVFVLQRFPMEPFQVLYVPNSSVC